MSGIDQDVLQRGNEVYEMIQSITERWPALRATAVVNMGVDFCLIPRALQAEEDLVRAINEFRSLEAIHTLVQIEGDRVA